MTMGDRCTIGEAFDDDYDQYQRPQEARGALEEPRPSPTPTWRDNARLRAAVSVLVAAGVLSVESEQRDACNDEVTPSDLENGLGTPVVCVLWNDHRGPHMAHTGYTWHRLGDADRPAVLRKRYVSAWESFDAEA